MEDFDLSEPFIALLPKLGVLVGVPCKHSTTLADSGRYNLSSDDGKLLGEFDEMMVVSQQAISTVEMLLGSVNSDAQADRKRRAEEGIGLGRETAGKRRRDRRGDPSDDDESMASGDEGCDFTWDDDAPMPGLEGRPLSNDDSTSTASRPGMPLLMGRNGSWLDDDSDYDSDEELDGLPPLTRQIERTATNTNHDVLLLGADTTGGSTFAEKQGISGRPVEVPRKVYRPPLTSMYKEPSLGPDLLENSEWTFESFGNALLHQKDELPPRANDGFDVIAFDLSTDHDELDRNLSLDGCPEHLHKHIVQTVKDYWDVFCQKGLRRPIRGFQFHIDTGDSPPVCVRTPRYGPYESKEMIKILEALEANGLIEDDYGPYG